VVLAAVLGLAIGWWARDLGPTRRAPPPGPAPADARPGDVIATDPTGPATAAEDEAALRLWSNLALTLATRSADLEALLAELQSEADDPRAAIDRAIASSSDAELAAILSAITRIDEEALLTQGDLRPFASRLVEVALDGLQGPSNEPPADRRVYFSSTTRDFDPDTAAQDAFPADQGRIFATIDLGDYPAERVMVKWVNTGTGRIHSLQSLNHRPGQPLWSYLGRDGGWDPGEYEVSVYTQDAAMQILARGRYSVF
jgi:hypothetical protein